jgi:membrane fusion protein, heavy metal efflux system
MKFLAPLCAIGLALIAAGGASPRTAFSADDAVARPAARVEARSADLWAVGVIHDDRMAIHLSRLSDNAPVRDAVLNVVLRGVVHPTTAEADGSYALQTKDLDLPGSAAVVFQVVQGNSREELQGALQVAEQPKQGDANSSRQLWWWVLNFAVCIGFLMLISRRRKASAAKD